MTLRTALDWTEEYDRRRARNVARSVAGIVYCDLYSNTYVAHDHTGRPLPVSFVTGREAQRHLELLYRVKQHLSALRLGGALSEHRT